jgi:hypothetical protein
MLGWRVFVHRLPDKEHIVSAPDVTTLSVIHMSDAERAALFGLLKGAGRRISEWSESAFGLRWIEPLLKDHRALALSQDGYPMAYIGLARDLIPVLLREGTITDVERKEFENCGPSDWLLVTAWDLS